MPTTIVVTDLTRFSNQQIICTAGIDQATGRCIRPMPYIPSAECQRLQILPGALLSSEFVVAANRRGPHQEDCTYDTIEFLGPCTGAQFRQVLDNSSFPTLGDGFEIQLPENQRFIPEDHPVQRSIITLSVRPEHVEIVEDDYNPGKIKVHFQDQGGNRFRYISVTDLGFHNYARRHHEEGDLIAVNNLLRQQHEVFLRIGLSRIYTAPNGRRGYWLQANGIYTFPHYHEGIRSYNP